MNILEIIGWLVIVLFVAAIITFLLLITASIIADMVVKRLKEEDLTK
jgi:hypothetical protein